MLEAGVWLEENVMLTWMRDRCLQQLVAGSAVGSADWRSRLSALRLNPYYTFPAIAVMEPAVRWRESSGRSLHVERLREFLAKQSKEGSELFVDEEGRLGLLFSWASKDRLQELRDRVKRHYGQGLNIGVGKPCSHLSDVHQSYNQAAEALRQKFYKGTDATIYYGEYDRYVTLPQYPAELENRLFAAFAAAKESVELEEAVRDYYEHILEEGPLAKQCICDATVKLLIGLEKKALAKTEHAAVYNRLDVMEVIGLETLDEMKRYVLSFLGGLKTVLGDTNKESQRSIIKKTIHYLEQECRDASLLSAAQKVYMTPTYLSLLFKLNTGKTFIEHLTDIRIDKAKDMLKSTHYKNYEVAEKVGYQDARYFSQIFKKKVGVSPSEYRETGEQ